MQVTNAVLTSLWSLKKHGISITWSQQAQVVHKDMGEEKKKKRSKQVSRNTWEFSWLRCKCSPVLWLLMAFLFRKRSGFVYILCFITLRSVNKFKDSVNVRARRITSIYFHSTSQSTAVWHHVSFIGGVMLMCSPCSNLSCSVKVKNSRWGSFDQM